MRAVDEVAAWVSDREAVASSEDVGKDLEHVEMLQKHFADFMKVKVTYIYIHAYIFILPSFVCVYV